MCVRFDGNAARARECTPERRHVKHQKISPLSSIQRTGFCLTALGTLFANSVLTLPSPSGPAPGPRPRAPPLRRTRFYPWLGCCALDVVCLFVFAPVQVARRVTVQAPLVRICLFVPLIVNDCLRHGLTCLLHVSRHLFFYLVYSRPSTHAIY